jgi:DNA-binding transcriptional regulator YiaG
MEAKKVLTRDNKPTSELFGSIEKTFKGIELEYTEVYYLDYEVNEDTGKINKTKKVKYYTKNQIDRNMKALKNAYLIAKGAAAPSEIISFRTRYRIPASTFSIVLGFSKNTISNIENEGITSLSSGRLIKMCLNNKNIIYQYIQLCDSIDNNKKEELSKRLMEESI